MPSIFFIPRLLRRIKRYVEVRIWTAAPNAMINTLMRFHATEADSAWQLLRVIPLADDPRQKHELFEHVLEEMTHADLFWAEAQRLNVLANGSSPMTTLVAPSDERRPILESRGALWRFFAYCVVGEQAAATEFHEVAAALPESLTRRIFRRILRDEAGHVTKARQLAEQLAPSAANLSKEILRVRRQRWRETWMRAGIRLTDLAANLVLTSFYYIAGPLGVVAARRRLFEKSTRHKEAKSHVSTSGVVVWVSR